MSTAREEFEKEAAAVMQIIRDMIDAGQLDGAGQLLDQYALLNPADPQIAQLRDIIAGGDKAHSADGADNTRPSFLDKIETIFIITSLGTKRSGFFNSIFSKVKLLEERLGYNSAILTCRHDIDFRKTEVWWKTFIGNSEILSPKTRMLNVYEYFQGSYAQGLENKAVFPKDFYGENPLKSPGKGLRYEQLSAKTYVVYDGDTRVRMEVYTGYSGSLRVERIYKGERIEKDMYYDDWGYLNYIREYDPDDETLFTAKYYTTAGKQCLEALFDTKKDEFEPQKVYVLDENGEISAELSSNEELAALYLSQIMNNTRADGDDRFFMLVFETGLVARIADSLDEDLKNFAKVSVVHSIFLKNAYNPSSGPQLYYEYVCNNPGKLDGIVFLTETERRDFQNMYRHGKKLFVIPHPYPFDILPVPFKERDLRKAVVISRLFPEKQLDLTIDIFSIVVKALPDVKLEIYGMGPEQEALEKHIKKRGMENNIFIMGYTDDAISQYRGAALSIMTSIAEGFGLTLMESICNGCPAFSLDMKYGPSDIIRHGKTGFLFPLGSKEKFARKMIEYFKNPEMQRTMSENCYADTDRFSRDVFLDGWTGMMEELYNRHKA